MVRHIMLASTSAYVDFNKLYNTREKPFKPHTLANSLCACATAKFSTYARDFHMYSFSCSRYSVPRFG